MIIKGFKKYHMSLVVLVKTMSVLINFLTENTNLVSVLMIICPNLANRTDEFRELSSVIKNGNSISMICIVLFKSLSICKDVIDDSIEKD